MPVTIADVAKVHPAPMIRAGLVTRDGQGEIVTGLVMMLIGENSPARSSSDVKEEIAKLQKSLPPGVTIEPLYDRTHLIDQTLGTVMTQPGGRRARWSSSSCWRCWATSAAA